MPHSPPRKVLIVDDDPGLLRLMEKALKHEGFLTATASAGQDAIQWFALNRADLMLLDLKLPDMGGQALITELANIGRSIPFIIITGQGDERVAVEMMKQGALDYLVKDVQMMDLVGTVVRRALEQLGRDKRFTAAQEALKESQKQLLAISEREQSRFGAELHDGLGQQLTAIELRCQSMKEDLPSDRADLRKQISEIGQFLREAIAQTRSLARGLSPVNLGSGRLVDALGELAGRMSKDGRVQCSLDAPASVVINEVSTAGHLFRIAQEAVNNAVKHSEATEIVIRLTDRDNALLLEISDNGKGLPATPNPDQGIGLEIMKHRASVIGAKLDLKSKIGKGLTVACTLRKKT